jgi:hypothetical protein
MCAFIIANHWRAPRIRVLINAISFYVLTENFSMNRVRVTVFNTTFNNISAAETRVPGESHRPVTSHYQPLSHVLISNTLHHGQDLIWNIIGLQNIRNSKDSVSPKEQLLLRSYGTCSLIYTYLCNRRRSFQ